MQQELTKPPTIAGIDADKWVEWIQKYWALGIPYAVGFNDGAYYLRSLVRNAVISDPSPRAAYEFITAARREHGEAISAFAVGLFDGQLYVWVYLPDIDVTKTKSLFDLKTTIEQSEQGEFELHVSPLQGQDASSSLPATFQMVEF